MDAKFPDFADEVTEEETQYYLSLSDERQKAYIKGLQRKYEKWLREMHRQNRGPVVEDGTEKFLDEEGRLHRDDGPAVRYSNGDKEWYKHGDRHREGAPAVITANSEQWYVNGVLHRDDGPAVVMASGTKYWYRRGVLIRSEEIAI